MSSDRTYQVDLTWEEVDDAMMALRNLIRDGERYTAEALTKGDYESVSENDQSTARLWHIVHKFGDARRVAHGEAPVLGNSDFDDLLEDA